MFGLKRGRDAGETRGPADDTGQVDDGVTGPIRSVGLDLQDRPEPEPGDERETAGSASAAEADVRRSAAVSEDTVAVPAQMPRQATSAAEEPTAAVSATPVSETDHEWEPEPAPVGVARPRDEVEQDTTAAPVAARRSSPAPTTRVENATAPTSPAKEADAEAAAAPAAALSAQERAQRARSGRAPDDRPDPRRPSLWRASRAAGREFGRDQCTDLAAALTYYAVLSILPAALALLSLLGLFAQPERFVERIEQVLRPLVAQSTLETIISPALESVASSSTAGISLVVGLVIALVSASAYVGAFGRAMNRILEVEEGRPVWKLRPAQILVTLAAVLLCAAALLILVVSGPVARSVGDVLGLQDTVVTVWDYAKWPVLALVVIAVVGLLYRSTPNARQPFRWLSPGAFVAIVVWLVASAAFALYVTNVAGYDRTFGSVAGGVVVALLWLWLTNLALLFGAELDSELERNRQLQAGLVAEDSLQLPLRDDRTITKRAAKHDKVVAGHREVREAFLGGGQVEDRPYR